MTQKDRVSRIIIHHNGNFNLVEQLLNDIHNLLGKYRQINGSFQWETEVDLDGKPI